MLGKKQYVSNTETDPGDFLSCPSNPEKHGNCK